MTAKPCYSSQVAKEKGHYEREFSLENSSLPVQDLILSVTPPLRAGTDFLGGSCTPEPCPQMLGTSVACRWKTDILSPREEKFLK